MCKNVRLIYMCMYHVIFGFETLVNHVNVYAKTSRIVKHCSWLSQGYLLPFFVVQKIQISLSNLMGNKD